MLDRSYEVGHRGKDSVPGTSPGQSNPFYWHLSVHHGLITYKVYLHTKTLNFFFLRLYF